MGLAQIPHVLSHQKEIRFPLLPGQSGASTARSVASEGNTLPFTTRPVWRKYPPVCRIRRKYAFLYYPASLAQVPHVLSHQEEIRSPYYPASLAQVPHVLSHQKEIRFPL